MIKEYENGNQLVDDNRSFLDKNKYMSMFFYLDAGLLTEINENNYGLKVEYNNHKLVALKVERYNLLLYGDVECLDELMSFIIKKNYNHSGIMCSTSIGDKLIKDYSFMVEISMDFMETTEYTEESSNEVIIANENDVDEIFECVKQFIIDCGLSDKPKKDSIIRDYKDFRLIKENNKIVSMAALSLGTEDSLKIAYVFTKSEYRGKGYARKVVNYLKNEILNQGKIATLNVDQQNPISNHLYESLGFKKVFSQGVYFKK